MKKYLTIPIFVVAAMLTSCSDWLDVTPENAISDEDLFENGFGYRNALNGIYINLADDALYGRELTWGFLSAIAQDYDQSASVSSPAYADASNLIYTSTETEPVVSAIWEKSYLAIANLNKLIENVVKANAGDFEYGDDERQLIYAEAVALRAMLHFQLLRLFAPAPATDPTDVYLPYREHYEATAGERLTVKDFLEHVLLDLNTAEPILKHFDTVVHPEAMYASQMMDNATPQWAARYRFLSTMYVDNMGLFFWFRGYRVNYLALLALKTRVGLYAGPDYYDLAYAAGRELYTEYYQQRRWVGFTDIADLTANMNTRHTKAADDVLFGLNKQLLAENYLNIVLRTSGATSSTRLPLANVQSLYASDISGVYTDYRFSQLIGQTNESQSSYYSLKFMPSNDETTNAYEAPLIPVIRFSEVCHALASICAYRNRIAEGIGYIEAVRMARGASRSLQLTVSNPQQLEEEILTDVRKEQTAEGGTFFEYKRRNLPTVPNANEQGQRTMTGHYTLPIPVSERTN